MSLNPVSAMERHTENRIWRSREGCLFIPDAKFE